jgi:hypothetical protein
MSDHHHHQTKKPENFGEFLALRGSEILGFILLVGIAIFTYVNKTYGLI